MAYMCALEPGYECNGCEECKEKHEDEEYKMRWERWEENYDSYREEEYIRSIERE